MKPGKVMWEVEELRYDYCDKQWYFQRPLRRKTRAHRLYLGNSPENMAQALIDAREALWADQKDLKAKYHAGISNLPGLEPTSDAIEREGMGG